MSTTQPDLPTTIDEDDSEENYYEKQVLKLTTIASVSSIIANVLISVTILKYKNLRQDVTHCILLHLVLIQIVSLCLDEILLWFFTYFGTPLPQHLLAFCVLFVGVQILNAISFLIIIILVVNWYLKLYCTDTTYMQFTKFYKLPLVLIYLACFSMFPMLARLCLKKDVFATFYVVLIFQILTILFTIYMNFLERCKHRNLPENVGNVGLGIANINAVFCAPAYLFLVLAYFSVIPVYLVLLADILATGLFPFVLLYMYKRDKTFQMYFKKLFTRAHRAKDDCISYNLINHMNV